MERTPPRESTIFHTPTRAIEVIPTKAARFTVRVRALEGWTLTRTNLSPSRAAGLALRAAKGLHKHALMRRVVPVRISIILYDVPLKGTGVEWLAMRALEGPRPIILKAPGLFRHRLIHIESTGEPGRFLMRIIDPFTDARTEPIEVSESVVTRAVTLFNHEHREDLLGQR